MSEKKSRLDNFLFELVSPILGILFGLAYFFSWIPLLYGIGAFFRQEWKTGLISITVAAVAYAFGRGVSVILKRADYKEPGEK